MERESNLLISPRVSIHYRISAPLATTPDVMTLVLLHGVASNLTRWSEFLEHTSLKTHFRIIRLDLRGHARSQTDIGVGMKNWCEDVIAILDRERIPQATIIGHSLGAQVGLNLAHRYPDRVSGMVLIDPVIPSALKGSMAFGRHVRWLVCAIASTLSFLRRIGFGKRGFPIRDLYVLDQRTREAIASNTAIDLAELYHSPSADIKFIPVANYVHDICEVLRPLPPLAEIRAPALTILATNPSLSHADSNQAVMNELPHNTVATINADHWPLTEKPRETREAIDKWCAQLARAGKNDGPRAAGNS